MGMRHVISSVVEALVGGERLDTTNAQPLKILPYSNDLGAIHLGDGSTDMDVKVFLGGTGKYVECNVGSEQVNLRGVTLDSNSTINTVNLNVSGAITGAASAADDWETLSSNTAIVINTHRYKFLKTGLASNAVHTLPNADGNTGVWFHFFRTVNFRLTLNTTDEFLGGPNNLTGGSIFTNTTDGSIRISSDGGAWRVTSQIGTWAET